MSRKFFDAKPYNNTDDELIIPVVDPGSPLDFSALKGAGPTSAAPAEAPPQKTAFSPASGSGPAAPATPGAADTTEPCPLCAEAEKARLLALAELENARKRLAREKEDFLRYAGENVIADILPALDNLDLALAYAPDSAECKNFVLGVDMTRKLLLDALSRHGLAPVGEPGELFDPASHEAVGIEPSPDYSSDQICKLLSKGYRLKDRLIRPAKVIVCKNDG